MRPGSASSASRPSSPPARLARPLSPAPRQGPPLQPGSCHRATGGQRAAPAAVIRPTLSQPSRASFAYGPVIGLCKSAWSWPLDPAAGSGRGRSRAEATQADPGRARTSRRVGSRLLPGLVGRSAAEGFVVAAGVLSWDWSRLPSVFLVGAHFKMVSCLLFERVAVEIYS